MKKLLVLFWTVCVLTGAFAQEKSDTPSSPQDIDYAFGLLMGQSLASTGLTLDPQLVLSGLKDSLDKSAKPRFDLETAKQIVSEALRGAQQKVNATRMAKEKDYLTEHGKKSGVVTTATGLQIEVLREGQGPKPKPTDTVKVDYTGTLADGTEFDSSIKRGEPAVFSLEQVIPGWTEGIQLMAVGGKYRLTIPSSLAYGEQGAGGGVVPPYATLIFEVDLLSIEVPKATLAPDAPEPAPAK
jgi:FKBP-type peptidyl-prolyl cis-trans isomerase FkpA